MRKINKNKVVFLSIFSILLTFSLISYSSIYEEGTNTIFKDIEFKLIVEDSLVVAKGSEIDFGDVLRGSTGKKIGKTSISINVSKNTSYIQAQYMLGVDEEDGSRKTEIDYIGEENDKKIKIENFDLENEKEKIDVFFHKLEDKYVVQLEQDVEEIEVKIPITAEIREIENVKLGKYEGKMILELNVVTMNEVLKENYEK